MAAESPHDLSDRERAILSAIDRRLPLKAVAGELGISESRVNQHVRALKQRYRVHSLPDLVDAWRGETAPSTPDEGYRNSAWRIPQVADEANRGERPSRVVPGEFVFADAAPLAIEAPWRMRIEPRVVPGALDGDNAVLLRLAVIIGIALGLIAAIVLVVTASLSLSAALDGTTAGTPERTGPAG